MEPTSVGKPWLSVWWTHCRVPESPRGLELQSDWRLVQVLFIRLTIMLHDCFMQHAKNGSVVERLRWHMTTCVLSMFAETCTPPV